MGFIVFFLQVSCLHFTMSILTTSLVWASQKKPLSSYASSGSLIKQYSPLLISKLKLSTPDYLKPLVDSSSVHLDMGILSLNLMRLGKMQTYKISVLVFLNSKEAKSEVFLQKKFFKELVANMLYSFSFKELKRKTILEKNYLEDLNIFINKGHINSLKIKMING